MIIHKHIHTHNNRTNKLTNRIQNLCILKTDYIGAVIRIMIKFTQTHQVNYLSVSNI